MPAFRSVFYIVGYFLILLAGAMTVPALVDAAVGEADWQVFATSAAMTVGFGGLMVLANRHDRVEIGLRQGFLLTVSSWLLVSAFGALPLWLSRLDLSLTDAVFESVSGLTTTGSTVLEELDRMPPGILIWRAMLQWLGGIGIIVMAVALLPFLKVGGMQLFRTESSDRSEKVKPRVTQIAVRIIVVYVGLTLACAIAYAAAGMGLFDAVLHAMTTLSTGGFSSSDASIAHFDSAAVDWVAVVFMMAGGVPFVLYVQTLQGRPSALWRNPQARSFVGLLLVATFALALWLDLSGAYPFLKALRFSAFNVVSIVTTTGYETANYAVWGGFAVTLFFFLTFVGGCTGSTAGGLKVFRFEVLFIMALRQLRQLAFPHAVYPNRYGDRVLPDEVALAVMSFFFVFMTGVVALAALLGALGLDFITSISAAATAVANVGPGLGPIIGPVGNFKPLPDLAKWLLALGMLLGRLEFFTVLVLFSPKFWRS